MQRLPLPVIAGPTASGKTALAVELAKRLDGEVISADSMQIYAELSIGTARPSADEMQGIPHHLIGFLPMEEAYSVARYAADAHRVIAAVAARGRMPILCGGTGLYIQAVTENLTFSQPSEEGADAALLRRRLADRLEAEGAKALYDELAAVDPDSAARLHLNDHKRLLRALEIYYQTGRTMSEQRRASHTVPSPYHACLLYLDYHDRQRLYARINERVDAMLAAGLLAEAERVLASPGGPTAMQAIGYKELAPYIDGRLPLAEAVENMKRETRRYAKRQLSWFRNRPGAYVLYVDDPGPPLGERALSLLRRTLPECMAPSVKKGAEDRWMDSCGGC